MTSPLIAWIKDEFIFLIFFAAKNKMSLISPKLRDRERTYIKEKVKSRDKYTCAEIPYDPVEKTGSYTVILEFGLVRPPLT